MLAREASYGLAERRRDAVPAETLAGRSLGSAPCSWDGVELTPKLIVFPFAKAAKRFANGAEDSVLSFFEIAELLAAEQRRGVLN